MAGLLHQYFVHFSKKENISKLDKRGNAKKDPKPLSSLGLKYSELRDHPLHTGYLWLEGKKLVDGAEGLWRIHDSLYDLSSFVKDHPGGKDWLKLTMGTDITEAFESHHLAGVAETLLPTYFIRKAKTPRNSPFTFKNNDFYKVLKSNVYKKLVHLPEKPAQRSKYLTDILFVSYIVLALLSVYFRSFLIGALSGISLSLTAIAAHNFFHQKDNFRMYYFDFTMMQSREWRISHALSHHLYTNTVDDLEISSLEPFLQYLPTEKFIFFRYISWLYSPIVYAFLYVGYFVRTLIQNVLNGEMFSWEIMLPFTVPAVMYWINKESLLFCLVMFYWIITISSIYFGIVGVNAAHHHPDIFHDGDAIRPNEEMDWGIYQMDAVMDRKDITGSHFLVLTTFGDHALHHLFPTVDHGYLELLYPVFLETCQQFGIEWRLTSQIELIKGQYRQLAKVEPNNVPPKSLKKFS